MVSIASQLYTGFLSFYQHTLAILITHSHDFTWLIDSFPREMPILRHLLFTYFFAVNQYFYFVAITISKDGNFLSFMALQIPVWERYARQVDVTASPRIGNKGNMGRNCLHASCKQENKKNHLLWS